jgi:HEPN domain-containing protein
MFDHCLRYADAGLHQFYEANWLLQQAPPSARTCCVLYARSGRIALKALLAALDQSAPTPSNLPSILNQLEQMGFGFDEQAALHARRLTRVLVLDRYDTGYDYAAQDLFGYDDAKACAVSAALFLDMCLRCLWSVSLSDALRPYEECDPQLARESLRQLLCSHAAQARRGRPG